ncbi:MAG: glycoside hydrolase family 20 zincin-like fold domain-containing protein, partial [Bacteroidales bacterium]
MLKKTLSVAALCTMLNGAIAQEVRLNPTPQKMEITCSETISTQNGFRLVDSDEALADALDFVTKNKNGVKLSVRFGAKIAKKQGVPALAGAYTLKTTPKGVSIVGYDEQGAYYGIQTLLQLAANGSVPCIDITDYPDLPYRGVVE